MIIKRDLESSLREYILRDEEHSNTLLLGGARQVGKSTLVEHVLKDFRGIVVNLYERASLSRSLDDIETFDALERLFKREFSFTPSEGTILVIDEAQEARRFGRWIRFFKEKWPHQKVIVLGSILSNLFEDNIAYPVGRVEELTLRPFSFKEYLSATGRDGLKDILEQANFERPLVEADISALIRPYLLYLQVGGMPAVVLDHHRGREEIPVMIDRLLGQYAMDVERHLKEVYTTMFLSAMKRIAEITCHPIKNSQIVSTDSTSYRRLPALLETMEKWRLVHRVAAETRHPESGGGIASKRYLFDVGFTNFFINHGMPVQWSKRTDSGNLVFPKLQENFVCNELVLARPSSTIPLRYYKETRNSAEIDFVVSLKDRIVPLEVKSSSNTGRNSLKPMLSFLRHFGSETGVLISTGGMKTTRIHDKTILHVPPFLVGEMERLLQSKTR